MEATIDLNLVATFVRVIEAGSFTAAGKSLGVPKSSVSRRVSALEAALRVQLLARSTRRLALTDAGRQYFERTRAALTSLSDASASVAEMADEVAGPIRFTAAPDGSGVLSRIIAEFVRRHPKVTMDVVLTPRRVDLLAEGFDLALRAGRLAESSLRVRRIGTAEIGLFASRAYLRRTGRPTHVAALADHPFVVFGPLHGRGPLRLDGPEGEVQVMVRGPLVVDEMAFATEAIAAGIGIGLLPVLLGGTAGPRAARGASYPLVRVLPAYGVRGSDLSIVWSPTAFEPTRVALFREHLATRMRELLFPNGADGDRGAG